MGASKSEQFTEEQNTLAQIAKALGHPARIAIMQFLVKSNKCICGDIVSELPLAQATVSQHLRELKDAGLIKGNIEGNAICYCVNRDTLSRYVQALQPFLEVHFDDAGYVPKNSGTSQ
jgi:ArsR family transcriptional regulator, arsenate/arsenite/antimonite-responsive transcriptional repressor